MVILFAFGTLVETIPLSNKPNSDSARELRTHAEQLQSILDAANVGTWSWDVASGVAHWDRRYHEQYGFDPAQPPSHQAWLGRVHPDDRSRLESRISALLDPRRGDTWSEEFRAIHPITGLRWMLGLGRVERDSAGQAICFRGVNLDITERKRLAEQLLLSQTKLDVVETQLQIGSWELNLETQAGWWSPGLFRLFNRPPELGAPPFAEFEEYVHPEDRIDIRSANLGVLVSSHWKGRDFRTNPELGPVRHMRASFAGVRDGDGRITHLVGATQDISDHTAKFDIELAHANRASLMGEMMASLAHELTQPLATLANNIGACQRGFALESLDRDELLAILNESLDETLRAGELIHRVRRFLTRVAPQFSPIKVHECVTQTLALARNFANHQQAKFIVDVEPATPDVSGDRVQLQQVLLNLIHNAVEAMQDQDQPKSIRLTAETVEPFVRIGVADSGPGVPAEVAAKIFEPYFTTSARGMGMGLAICKAIMESHSGRVELVSRAPQSAQFVVSVPIYRETFP